MIYLEPDEKILLKARKHWFVMLVETFFLILLSLAPLGAIALYQASGLSELLSPGDGGFFFASFLALAWFLFLWLAFFAVWTDYYLDMLVLSTKRLIDIEQRGFFRREVSTIALGNVQDITVRVHGLLPTLLDFGDLHIQSAGAEREFVVRQVARPYKVKSELLETMRHAVKAQG